MSDLEKLRERITRLDRQIAVLLTERLEIAREIGAVKRASSLPVEDPGRERIVLDAVRDQACRSARGSTGEAVADRVERIYLSIILESKNFQTE